MQAHNNILMKFRNWFYSLKTVCTQACEELEEELNLIKKHK